MRLSIHRLLMLFKLKRTPKRPGFIDTINHEKLMQIVRDMTEIMETNKPFLKSHYTIGSLADDLTIPSYQLSALLNQKMGSNFNDYINRFRIRHCIDLIHTGMGSRLNLKGLSAKCGFHNRNSFSAAFKKFTGRSPSEYSRYYFRTGFETGEPKLA